MVPSPLLIPSMPTIRIVILGVRRLMGGHSGWAVLPNTPGMSRAY
jgi:hypothetical protein